MWTEEELRISNKSYINKDFPVLYPELIDTFKKLTNRYDPELSNESDPMIVLLKLTAMMGDKINYNIDKNVLENYPVSATQESSMRKLCDMLGYEMNYYIAPEVDVTFMYTDSKIGDLTNGGSITLPALSTILTSKEDEEISFVLVEDVTLIKQNQAMSGLAMQGEIKTLMVNTSGDIVGDTTTQEVIQLDNLTDNNRIYFPETNVAQNGVFICNVDDNNYWKITKNLNYETSNSKVFKFGFDSVRNAPYVQFPEDISDLIGNGLVIKYIITDGYEGNVKANIINQIASTSVSNENYDFGTEEGDAQYLYIRNLSGAINGANPETNTEAYNGFKRTVGTFNTLVTCRDYANAIYNMKDSNNLYNVVSNVQVADRRDDINYCTNVISYDRYGSTIINIASNLINAFDLCCYPLAPMTSYSEEEYLKSFSPTTMTSYIKASLEEMKDASHDYKEITLNDIYLFKNYLTLNANISTTYKVNDAERVEIIANVEKELIKHFNAREVDYGYEIPFDTLLNVIENADKRISSVSLAEPHLTTKVMKKSGEETLLISQDGASAYVDLMSKNILAGKVPLFEYDNRFAYDFGQAQISNNEMVVEKIGKIKTEANIEITNNTEYPLQPNEVIQIIAPSIVTKTTYPAYVYFSLISTTHTKDNPITNDTNYELKSGEQLVIYYTDSDDNQQVIIYGCDDTGLYVQKNFGAKDYSVKPFVIQPQKLLNTINGLYAVYGSTSQESYTTTGRSYIEKTFGGNTYKFYSLGSKEELCIRELARVDLNKRLQCYWLKNNSSNKLFSDEDAIYDDNQHIIGYKTVLQDGEYFFYTDTSETTLASLGSGTTIRSNYVGSDWTCDKVSLNEIVDKGMLAIKDYWRYLPLTSLNNMVLTENQILTLTQDDKIEMSGLTSTLTLSNTLVPLDDAVVVHYTIDGTTETLETFEGSIEDLKWKIKSRLDIDVSNGDSQVLYTNQKVSFYVENQTSPALVLDGNDGSTELICFNLNLPSHLIGADDIDVVVNSITYNAQGEEVKTPTYPISVYNYKLLLEDTEIIAPSRNMYGYETIRIGDDKQLDDNTIIYSVPAIKNGGTLEDSVFMIYLTKLSDDGSLVIEVDDCELSLYNNETPAGVVVDTTSAVISQEGLYVFKLSNVQSEASISFSRSGNLTGSLTLGTLDVYSGLNKDLGINEFAEEVSSISEQGDLINPLMNSLRGKNFYYNNKQDSIKMLNLDSTTTPSYTLISPYTLYEFNNVANKFTISEIDFSTSKIDVVRSSRV